MNILQEIIENKKAELVKRKKEWSISRLEQERFFSRKTLSLKSSVLDPGKLGVIAEYKRRSPSKGVINNTHSVEAVTKAYAAYGASGISVLTDLKYFGGSLDDLVAARDNGIPVLRKEFIIDEYQLIESKAFGADAILLIAACLSKTEVAHLSSVADFLGLEILLELHDESELDHINENIDLVGINNRNLKDFKVDLDHSVRLAKKLPADKTKIAESGIQSVQDLQYLKQSGFDGFLIGELFMKQENPMMAFKNFSYEV